MFYTAIEALTIGIMSANAPYGTTYTSPAPPLFATPFITAANGQNVGPVLSGSACAAEHHGEPSRTRVSTGRSLNPSTGCQLIRPAIRFLTPRNTCSRSSAASGSNTVLDASYVGTQAHHLLVLEEANPGNPALCLQLSNPANLAPGQTPCGPFNESNVFTTASGQAINGTRGPAGTEFRKRYHSRPPSATRTTTLCRSPCGTPADRCSCWRHIRIANPWINLPIWAKKSTRSIRR